MVLEKFYIQLERGFYSDLDKVYGIEKMLHYLTLIKSRKAIQRNTE